MTLESEDPSPDPVSTFTRETRLMCCPKILLWKDLGLPGQAVSFY